MTTKKSDAVLMPNLGLFLGKAHIGLDNRALRDGNNFRLIHGKISNLNIGWDRFSTFTLDGPVTLIKDFFLRDGTENLVLATTTSIYRYDVASNTVKYLNHRYATGTASASGTAVTGVGTAWLANAKTGDFISFGNNAQNLTTATWFKIQSVIDDTHITLATTAGTVGSGVYTIRQSFTGGILDIWGTAIFYNASPSNADELWITNGIDNIIRWNGTDTQVEVMTGLGFTAKVIGNYSNMMIFGNVTQSGTKKPADILNSDVGLPQNVGLASTGLSNQFKVHGNFGELYSFNTIGDTLAMYSRYTVTLAQFTGDTTVFAFRQVISNQGAVGFRAVADFGDHHQFVGKDGLYAFDGASITEIGEHTFREVLLNLKPSNRTFTFNSFNDVYAEVIWVVPQTSDLTSAPTTAYPEHYLEDTMTSTNVVPFSKRDFPFTAAGSFTRQNNLTWDQLTGIWSAQNFRWNDQFFAVAFPLVLVGDINGMIYTLNSGQSGNGQPLSSFVRFGRRPLFEGRTRGLLTRVYPFLFNAGNSIQVSVLMSNMVEATEAITDTQNFNGTSDTPHFTTHYRRGRFYEIKVGSTQGFELSGYDIDKRPGGMR